MAAIAATRELEVAREAARCGGAILSEQFRQAVAVRTKHTVELVTDADLASEAAIVALIRREFPKHEILGEEGHDADLTADDLWIVDPLDGTTNFAHKVPHFAVSVAYYHKGMPQCGVVWNPVRDDWYEASSGQGAWHNGERVSVSPATRLSDVLVGVGFYYDRAARWKRRWRRSRICSGSRFTASAASARQRLDLCHVGTGLYGRSSVSVVAVGFRRRPAVRRRGWRAGDDVRPAMLCRSRKPTSSHRTPRCTNRCSRS